MCGEPRAIRRTMQRDEALDGDDRKKFIMQIRDNFGQMHHAVWPLGWDRRSVNYANCIERRECRQRFSVRFWIYI